MVRKAKAMRSWRSRGRIFQRPREMRAGLRDGENSKLWLSGRRPGRDAEKRLQNTKGKIRKNSEGWEMFRGRIKGS